ncbi:hypothetical protein K2173_016229 [Erythroxylum novogranatense]|uniref:Uncharacterized protein n=1 Tax=Erythroxylum novogranatense TaxID=1862640 RepID=A0AAV8SFV3_9ROSI|nr:hypothetical protein K2173_016229 [Erythroxylum novogranatense]
MGSGYYGEPNLSHERGGSSRKSKKINSDKPKQPQRGLGVAQLEKIRLHGQMGSYHPSLHGTYPTGFNQEDIGMQAAFSSAPSSSFSYSSPTTSSPSYGYPPNIMMGIGDYERTNIGYGDSLASTAASWNQSNSFLENQHFAQPSTARHVLNPPYEDSKQKKNRKKFSDSRGSSSQNSESSDGQELDLELRLSI